MFKLKKSKPIPAPVDKSDNEVSDKEPKAQVDYVSFKEVDGATVYTAHDFLELEKELEAKGDIAGDRRTKEWDKAVREKIDADGFARGHIAGYKEGYQDGHADGKDSGQCGNRLTGRNKYPGV